MLNILFYIVMTLWALGVVFGLYMVVLSIQGKRYPDVMYIVHNGQYMSLKHYYDNFVDIQ